MAISIKAQISHLHEAAQKSCPKSKTSPVMLLLLQAKGVIETLENRISGTITARDQIALHLLPAVISEIEVCEGMEPLMEIAIREAFKRADLFIKVSKEVGDGA